MNFKKILKHNESVKDRAINNCLKDQETLKSLTSCKAQSDNRARLTGNDALKHFQEPQSAQVVIFLFRLNLN